MLVFTAASLVFAACNNEKTEGGDAEKLIKKL